MPCCAVLCCAVLCMLIGWSGFRREGGRERGRGREGGRGRPPLCNPYPHEQPIHTPQLLTPWAHTPCPHAPLPLPHFPPGQACPEGAVLTCCPSPTPRPLPRGAGLPRRCLSTWGRPLGTGAATSRPVRALAPLPRLASPAAGPARSRQQPRCLLASFPLDQPPTRALSRPNQPARAINARLTAPASHRP